MYHFLKFPRAMKSTIDYYELKEVKDDGLFRIIECFLFLMHKLILFFSTFDKPQRKLLSSVIA